MKAKFYSIFITIFLCSVSLSTFAQDPGDPGGGDPGGNNNSAVPIDSGLILLLGAGIGYGAKKAVDMKQKKSQSQDSQSNF
jgi:hypothetical protein